MIEILEGYMDQFHGSALQPPCSPMTHSNKALMRISRLSYILHAWFPEVTCDCLPVVLKTKICDLRFRMTENRDKWRKYIHGVAIPRIEAG